MKNLLFLSSILFLSLQIQAQKYWTQNGHISFFSEAPLENIEAENKQVSSVFNTENGDLVFNVLMKAFIFEKALMQEHFNEKYVESDKYPKSTFKGRIADFNEIDINSKEIQKVVVKGTLTMHGTSNEVEAEGTLQFDGEKIIAKSEFNVLLSDYKIKIPSVVKDNISNNILISLNMNYKPYGK